MSAPERPSPADPRAQLSGTTLGVLGCGAVGRAFAHALSASGAAVHLWSRTSAHAEQLARELPLGAHVTLADGPRDVLAQSDAVLITVTDRALERFVRDLAAGPELEGDAPVLHTNGTLGLEVLAPLAPFAPFAPFVQGTTSEVARRGTGKLHPLAALPPGATNARAFEGAWFATLGAGDARAWTARIVAGVGGRELRLSDTHPDPSRALHAAAALLSGGMVALFDLAAEAARGTTQPDSEGAEARALAALLDGTLRNRARGLERERSEGSGADVGRRAAQGALTGPIARGAADVVRAQLAALAAAPDAQASYRVLGRRMLALALARGTVSAAEHEELARVLT